MLTALEVDTRLLVQSEVRCSAVQYSTVRSTWTAESRNMCVKKETGTTLLYHHGQPADGSFMYKVYTQYVCFRGAQSMQLSVHKLFGINRFVLRYIAN